MKSSTFFGLSSFSLLTLISSASAHGFLRTLTVDGTDFAGNVPNASPNPSAIRQIDDVSPVKGATNRAVNCGQNAQIAQLSATANPGSNLTFDWAGGDGSKVCDSFLQCQAYGSTDTNLILTVAAQHWADDDLPRLMRYFSVLLL